MKLHQFQWPRGWPLEKRKAPSSALCSYREAGVRCGVLQINHPELCPECYGKEQLTCKKCWNGYVFPGF